jgi:hypothetical protein
LLLLTGSAATSIGAAIGAATGRTAAVFVALSPEHLPAAFASFAQQAGFSAVEAATFLTIGSAVTAAADAVPAPVGVGQAAVPIFSFEQHALPADFVHCAFALNAVIAIKATKNNNFFIFKLYLNFIKLF